MRRLFILLIVLTSGCIGQKVCFENDNCVKVEIVDKPEDISRGLMFRESLPKDGGMLFIFEQEAVHPFWMKNMNFPIDMIWIDKGMTAVHIERSVPPCTDDPCPTYNPGVRALYVLEVNANYTLENDIAVGSKVRGSPPILPD